MVATVILGMLCINLLCFCALFLLISVRLRDQRMGTNLFALGNILLGLSYLLQLLEGPPGWSVISLVNHTLTLSAPVVYMLGALRFFNRSTAALKPLLIFVSAYTVAQILVQVLLGTEARYVLLAGTSAVFFLGITLAALYSTRSVAKGLRVEMLIFAILISGIAAMNAGKLSLILTGGLASLDMNSRFQTAFYLYMSFLGTVLPPCVVWLILRRLSDELLSLASLDPLTGLLNRRGLIDFLERYLRTRSAKPVYLLMVDIDHFKQINDTHGHQAGDQVLSRTAEVLKHTAREGDLACRLGGEEFVVAALDTDYPGAQQLAERIRAAIADSHKTEGDPATAIACTATLGVSTGFSHIAALDTSLEQADAALYRGKLSGRNRVEWACVPENSTSI